MNFARFLAVAASKIALEPKRRVYRLEVESRDLELLTVKDFIQRTCDAAGCNSKETANITLAVDEACSNIIRHAYAGKKDGKIQLEVGVSLIDMKIRIVDYGKSFDFRGVKDPDINEYVDIGRKGGLGIWLIKKVMDRVAYRSYPDHNEMILYRRLSMAPPEEMGLKKGTFSVSTKFTFGSAALVFLLILSAYFFLTFRQESLVSRQQKEKINLIVQTISSGAGGAVSQKNDLELDRLIREERREDKDGILSYILVVGSDQKVLAHSDLTQLFKDYAPPSGAPASRVPGVRETKRTVDGRPLTDYASAIFFRGEWVGEVHVGVSEDAIQAVLRKVKIDYLRLVLWIFIVSMLGLYLLSRIVIRPFQKILEGVHAMSMGDLNAKIDLKSQDEFGQLANIFNEMTTRIQDSQKGLMAQERLEKEMQVAQEIQHTLLPTEFPQIDGYEIGAVYRAAKEVGGDYYDFFWVDPTTLGIVVADVSGKGVPGSMVMTMIRTAMRLEARGNKSAADVLGKINSHVTSDMRKGMFVTMFYIILDSRNRSINFASAGHNPMILYREETKEVYFLKPKGFPVGIDLPDSDMFGKSLALQKVSLHKNDMLVVYTDGVTEAMNAKQEQFGEERLIQVIKENAHLTPAEFIGKLDENLARFTQSQEQHDDITVVAIKEKLRAENVVFKFRKKLLDLVDKKGMSVAEACRQMNISPKTYYHYKKISDEKGRQGLKPLRHKERHLMQELTMLQKEAILGVVREHPEYGTRRIVSALAEKEDRPLVLETRLVHRFLQRRGLKSAGERKAYSPNSVDTP
jgi:serine phosphatase RsbU (regulator of sigma subunit)/anti-sigma regulatory factor (Ser/Thr protein kinase)/transposase